MYLRHQPVHPVCNRVHLSLNCSEIGWGETIRSPVNTPCAHRRCRRWGIIAIELAEGLAAQGLQVHYFLRGDRFWASVLDETESRMVERGLEAEGIRLHFWAP